MENVEEQESKMDELLQKMLYNRGFDVRNYKMSNLQRRISRRMDVLGVSSLVKYSEYLEANPDEYEALFNAILVNITQFFRNPEAWNFVREKVLPEILDKGGEIRIWSAGCASGEEPYSMAITLAEMLGDDLHERRIRIYATDIDEAALKFARSGTYAADQLVGVPEDMRERYFTRRGNVYTIAGDIRRLLIFSHHNLVSDPPIPRIDLLICRNVLIYFNRALQSMIIPKLQYALRDAGYLWLGEAGTLLSGVHSLKPLNTEWCVFKKGTFSIPPQRDSLNHATRHTKTDSISANERFEQITQNIRTGLIVLDEDYNVVICNKFIKGIWGIPPEQILGRSLFDMEISYRPVDLKYRIEQAVITRKSSVVENAEHWITRDRRIYLKIEIIPIVTDRLTVSGVTILLEDVTEQYELRKELQTANKALEAAYEKLLLTNRELENANEEFQSVNKELQSVNEELESTNEDLKATNEELTARIAGLSILDRYHEMVLNSIGDSVIVTDKDLLVKTWNAAATDMWGSGDDEAVGSPLMSLDIGLPLERLADQLRDAIKMSKPAADTLECVDRWGKRIMVNVSINPLIGGESVRSLPSSGAKGLVLIVKKTIDEVMASTTEDFQESSHLLARR